jgi:hypothetical protein
MKKCLTIVMVLMAGTLFAGGSYWKQIEVQKGFYEDGITPKIVIENVWVIEENKKSEKPELNYHYEKRMLAGEKYEIWIVADGCVKKVNEEKPDYIAYVEKGYDVKVIPYVAPPEQSLDDLKAIAIADAERQKRGEHERQMWEKSTQKAELDALKEQIKSTKDKAELEAIK